MRVINKMIRYLMGVLFVWTRMKKNYINFRKIKWKIIKMYLKIIITMKYVIRCMKKINNLKLMVKMDKVNKVNNIYNKMGMIFTIIIVLIIFNTIPKMGN